ncbi:MAG: PAS domain-containing protein [Ferruginibacter sp.]
MKLKTIALSDTMFFVVVLLLAILSFFSYRNINVLGSQSERITHTHLVKFQLELASFNIRDAEREEQMFFLAADSAFFSLYSRAISQIASNIGIVDSLTTDNTNQQHNLAELRLLISKRFTLKRNANSSANQQNSTRMLFAARADEMKKINVLIDKMIQVEEGLLTERTGRKNASAYITPFFSLLLSIFAIVLIGLVYFFLRGEIRKRFNAEGHVNKLQDYFKDIPALFAIVKGPSHIHEFANSFYHEIFGKRDLLNKPFCEAFPDLEQQGFCKLLDKVYSSGELFLGKEMPVTIDKGNNGLAKGYFNFMYQPILNNNHQITGILIFGYEITEVIESRKKLEELEQRSRLAIEAANIGTYDWDLENNRFDSSVRLIEIFGFDNAESTPSHQDLINTFHPDDKAIRNKAVEQSYGKGLLKYEARIRWPDGTIHKISVHGKVIYEQKTPLRMLGTVIDITEQHAILEELKESEAKFRLLADSMPHFVWTGDHQGKLDYFNRAVFDYTGLSMEKIDHESWMAMVHPDEQQENIQKWGEAIETGKEFIFEHRFKNKDGNYRWQINRALPQKDQHGKIQRWVGNSTDIQDQKNIAEELEQQINERTHELSELNKFLVIKNNIFSQAEEIALIGSYVWNLQSGDLEYSDNLFRLMGYEPNEFVPSFDKYLSMIHPDDKDQVLKDGMETMQTKMLSANIYRIIDKKGLIKHFRSTGIVIGEDDNKVLIGTVQDISQDIVLNEILRVKNLQLERTNAELESFNYIASHDLQEPLRKIQSFSQRIFQKESAHFTEAGKDYFSRINSAAARMQNLIDALLNYSRAVGLPYQTKVLDLTAILNNVLFDLQDIIEEKNAQIELAPLPEIHGFSVQVHQLFVNIISNAIKYSKPGIAPYIKIQSAIVKGTEITDDAANRKSEYIRISVTDNGIGFEQEFEHKIFQLFQRLHSSEDYVGTGIGLAICKKIMLNHQGFITATGHPGIGSVFSIYFPSSI